MKLKKIYILSDDIFFSLGMVTLLSMAGCEPFIIDYTSHLPNIDECHTEPCIVIVDTHPRERFEILRRNNVPHTTKLVFVTCYDGDQDQPQGFLEVFMPRRIACENVLSWLVEYIKTERRNFYQLTRCEELVFQLLIEGHALSVVSEQLNLSVKCISQHKANILYKLGVKKMNAKSLFYLRDYINKTVFLEQHLGLFKG